MGDSPVPEKGDIDDTLSSGPKRKILSSTSTSTATSPGSPMASPEALTPASSITSPENDRKDELALLFEDQKTDLKNNEDTEVSGSAEMPMESIDDLIDSLFGPEDQESEGQSGSPKSKPSSPFESSTSSGQSIESSHESPSTKTVDMSDLPENIRHFFPEARCHESNRAYEVKRTKLDDAPSKISSSTQHLISSEYQPPLHPSYPSHRLPPSKSPVVYTHTSPVITPSVNPATVRQLKEQMLATHTLLTTYTALKTAYAKVCTDLQKTVISLKQIQHANYQILMESNYLKCENNILSKEKHMLKEALSKFHKETNTSKVQLLKAEISLKNDEIVRLKRKCQELV
ncbi:hypothetical protein NADFUDRAFT_51580 [Nadsonia fulvescens var. elongata DSM 6958]|uniref:Uncharacterized protein n=1 Tax=Nadsonia fulvescens var. elongata DSM 6958 TaxID=857566 RepID=A0A1E3PJ84_9ASCO|nr:hypothetical protein NADFUDRAFT_51580 [Nadsonia fulvescens var. elongata DSM 6958]